MNNMEYIKINNTTAERITQVSEVISVDELERQIRDLVNRKFSLQAEISDMDKKISELQKEITELTKIGVKSLSTTIDEEIIK